MLCDEAKGRDDGGSRCSPRLRRTFRLHVTRRITCFPTAVHYRYLDPCKTPQRWRGAGGGPYSCNNLNPIKSTPKAEFIVLKLLLNHKLSVVLGLSILVQ